MGGDSVVTATYFQLHAADSLTISGETFRGTDGPDGVVLSSGASISFNPTQQGDLQTGFRLCASESPWLPQTEEDRPLILRRSCTVHVRLITTCSSSEVCHLHYEEWKHFVINEVVTHDSVSSRSRETYG